MKRNADKYLITFVLFFLALYFIKYSDVISAKLGMSNLFSMEVIKYIKIFFPIMNFIIGISVWFEVLYFSALLLSVITSSCYLLYSLILNYNLNYTCDCGNIFPMVKLEYQVIFFLIFTLYLFLKLIFKK